MAISKGKVQELFGASSIIGELLQQRCSSPSDATAVLFIVLGRLLAREGFPKTSREAWETIIIDASREFFNLGYEEENHTGHYGPLRKER
jgi:hypothetical protein